MKKKLVRLTENDLHRIVENSVRRVLREDIGDADDEWGGKCHDPNDTHFAVNKSTNLIVFGWDYSNEDPEDLRLFKNDYFINDLRDNDFNPKEYRILTKRTMKRRNIDPDESYNWSNDGITPCVKK